MFSGLLKLEDPRVVDSSCLRARNHYSNGGLVPYSVNNNREMDIKVEAGPQG